MKTVRREEWVCKKSKMGTKKRSINGQSQPNQNTIIMNIIC